MSTFSVIFMGSVEQSCRMTQMHMEDILKSPLVYFDSMDFKIIFSPLVRC